jgi:hypothetical protein
MDGSPGGPSADLWEVAYGNGRFVAVGSGGTIIYSENGRAWSPASCPVTNSINGVAYGAGKWIAVGDGGTLLDSVNNGADWTDLGLAPLYTENLLDVAYADGRFVMISKDDIFYSDDGATWHLAAEFPDGPELRGVGGR